MKLAAISLGLAAALAAGTPLAQQDREWGRGKMPPPQYGGRMDRGERERMRDDLRSANRDMRRDRQPRQLSPQEREQLRRDIQEANRRMERR